MGTYFLLFLLLGAASVSAEQRADEPCDEPNPPSCEDHFDHPPPGCCEDSNGACVAAGGMCKLGWQDKCKCDEIIEGSCGENCSCCIECRLDVYSSCALDGGICKKTCGRNFIEDTSQSCTFSNCQCCKRCDDSLCTALFPKSCAFSEAKYCRNGHYFVDAARSGGICGCCVPCTASASCQNAGGYAERTGVPCKMGYESSEDDTDGSCTCCLPTEYDGCPNAYFFNLTLTDYKTRGECFQNYKQVFLGISSEDLEPCHCCYAGGCQRCQREGSCIVDEGCCTTGECQCKDYWKDSTGCTSNDDIPCACCKHKCHWM